MQPPPTGRFPKPPTGGPSLSPSPSPSATPAPAPASPNAGRSSNATATGRASMAQVNPADRQVTARLSYSLAHVMRLFRHAAAAAGREVGDLLQLEEQLARAQLPEDYVEVSRAIAALQMSAGAGGEDRASNLPAPVFGRLVMAFRDIARALELPLLEDEIRALASSAADAEVDPEPLFEVARRLVASVQVHRNTTEVLGDCLTQVQGGIRRLADAEVDATTRLASTRNRLAAASDARDLDEARVTLLQETASLERLVADRRAALADLERQSHAAQRRAERLLAELADANTAASTDALTQLGNRRALADAVQALAAVPSDTGVLALDVDHFKRVNDAYGHAGGDVVLRHVADVIRAELRGDDLAFRTGGEELVVLLARCDTEGAFRTAERIRARLERSPVMVGPQRVLVTTSVGVAVWHPRRTFEATLEAADEALYRAKRGGRNRTEVAVG